MQNEGHRRWRWEVRDMGYETPCWLWLNYCNRDGYGRIGDRPAHCVIYKEVVGPIPEGKQLDHKCRVRRCVNPDHVEPVTSRENTRRGKLARLTLVEVGQIRDLAKGGPYSYREIGEFYGVAHNHVSDIVNRKRWK